MTVAAVTKPHFLQYCCSSVGSEFAEIQAIKGADKRHMKGMHASETMVSRHSCD